MTRFGRTGSGRPLALRLAVGVVLASGLALSTAGCGDDGGGSAKNKVASGGGGGEKAGGQSDSGKKGDASDREQMVKFAGCMREHGIDMPDPEPGEGGAMSAMGVPADGDMSKTENALKACEKYQPKSDFDPNDPKFKEWQAKNAECMRENGVDMGDGTGMVTLEAGDEKTTKALEVCNKKVPPFEKKK
ncbi:hypothetical protein OG948_30280 [Embleya sp. NBC_00888]|uniref:hypothetical protein n=1 Tax=Embleya sp. NBC_00888 TaxID=2975960 RepID=UPI003866469E|nr:hypothetical protein OG948_30280 [Embleya sp. NBC_00888]